METCVTAGFTNTWKLAFIGEPGAGKSTCIDALSDIDVVRTEVPSRGALALRKSTTTVAFDYGEMDLGDQGRLLLYGLPGQARFDFMFDVVRDNLAGVVVLVDAQSPAPVDGLAETLETYAEMIRPYPIVVAINKAHADPDTLRDRVSAVLHRFRLVAPVINVDARIRADMARIFELIFLCAEYA